MKPTAGVTLLEMIIALGLWMILASGVFFAWQFAVQRSFELMAQQSALENARVTMDALKVNIQLARRIELPSAGTYLLMTCQPSTASSRNCRLGGFWHDYRFELNSSLNQFRIGQPPNNFNEMARYIGNIEIEYIDGSRLQITVQTTCDPPIILQSSVCVRGKCVNRCHE